MYLCTRRVVLFYAHYSLPALFLLKIVPRIDHLERWTTDHLASPRITHYLMCFYWGKCEVLPASPRITSHHLEFIYGLFILFFCRTSLTLMHYLKRRIFWNLTQNLSEVRQQSAILSVCVIISVIISFSTHRIYQAGNQYKHNYNTEIMTI